MGRKTNLYQITDKTLDNLSIYVIPDEEVSNHKDAKIKITRSLYEYLEKFKGKGPFEETEFQQLLDAFTIKPKIGWSQGLEDRIFKFSEVKEKSFLTRTGNIIAENLARPTVIIAIITTLFGTLAVGIAANLVTKSLGEKEIQLEVVKQLITETSKNKLNDNDILKLSALIRLIIENEQYNVQLDGYQNIVATHYDRRSVEIENKIKEYEERLKRPYLSEREEDDLRIEIIKLTNQKRQYDLKKDADRSKISDIQQEYATNIENFEEQIKDLKTTLAINQNLIHDKNKSISNLNNKNSALKKERDSLLSEKAGLTKSLTTNKENKDKELEGIEKSYQDQIDGLTTKLSESDKNIKSTEDENKSLIKKLSESQKVKNVTIDINSTEKSKSGIISVMFTNNSVQGSSDKISWFDNAILEFTFPGDKEGQFQIKRKLQDDTFSKAKFIRVINPRSKDWSGTIKLKVDGVTLANLNVIKLDKDKPYQYELVSN